MIETLQDIVAGLLIAAGGFFLIVGAIGLNRMPDFFTRLHAASVADTLGVSLMLAGMMVLGGFTLVTVKLVFLLGFLLFVGPVVTHALARAGLHAGIKPVLAADAGAPAETSVKMPAKPAAKARRAPVRRKPVKKG